ncbi:hypothetical protein [Burkholderia lata]|uniref:hypothetical protein n=1 Tax=Burkholderia lata (strain ATCC 17760 / DSM 23089 / LMG 22485 / NCIMB 9086 / R18194 / 383) TaxID=482957 RepID=UPI0034A04D4B
MEATIHAFASRTVVWDAPQMAEAGAFVIVGPQGELVIKRGLVRRENSAALDAAGATVTAPFRTKPSSTGSTRNPIRPTGPGSIRQ